MLVVERSDEKKKSKERILESATKFFAQKGFERVGIREICKEANTNSCMISYFWGSKEALYQGILNDLIDKQTEHSKTFLNFDIEPSTLSKEEQIKLLYTGTDKFIEFFCGGMISDDSFRFLLQVQQNRNVELTSPTTVYLRKIIAAIFNKDINDKDIIFKTIFVISLLNSPKILPVFSLGIFKQDTFMPEDKEIIKKNVLLYIETLIKEANIV